MHVTDARLETQWSAMSDQPGEWIMVDLEGRKKAITGHIALAYLAESERRCEIAYSYDGKRFMPIVEVRVDLEAAKLVFDLPSGGLRYLKVTFPESPVAVKEIGVYT